MAVQPPKLSKPLNYNLNALLLISTSISANVAFKPESSATLKTNFTLTVIRGDGGNDLKRQVHLVLDLQMGDDPSATPYIGNVQAMADITFKAAEDAAALDKAAVWSAINPLVGLVRSHVLATTALGPYNRILLGPVPTGPAISRTLVIERDGAEPRPLYTDLERESPSTQP